MLKSSLFRLSRGLTSRAFSAEVLDVKGRQVIDSRGNPTVEADVVTSKGVFRAMVPSGASTGIYEALELRDGGNAYGGKGVLNACNNIHKLLKPALLGQNCTDQAKLDKLMVEEVDGSKNEYDGLNQT